MPCERSAEMIWRAFSNGYRLTKMLVFGVCFTWVAPHGLLSGVRAITLAVTRSCDRSLGSLEEPENALTKMDSTNPPNPPLPPPGGFLFFFCFFLPSMPHRRCAMPCAEGWAIRAASLGGCSPHMPCSMQLWNWKSQVVKVGNLNLWKGESVDQLMDEIATTFFSDINSDDAIFL